MARPCSDPAVRANEAREREKDRVFKPGLRGAASSLWKVVNWLGISASTTKIIEHDGVSAMRHLVEKKGALK
jgi:hypothetical protein